METPPNRPIVVIPRMTCTCDAGGKSSVNHRNVCPIKQEAIKRLHLSAENPFVLAGC